MKVVVVGAHGGVARRLTPLVVAAGGQVVGVVRNPDHVADLQADGAEPVVLDVETAAAADLAPHLAGADAVVFSAGAGGKGPAERKDRVDRAASVMLADAARIAGVRRYLLVSAMGLDAVIDGAVPDGVDPGFVGFVDYLRAKLASEDELRSHVDLDLTILRPGRLTDDAGTGRVLLSRSTIEMGSVPRADVAAVLLALLQAPGTAGELLELVGGDTPVEEAVAALA